MRQGLSHNQWLGGIFFIYLCTLFLFARIYQLIYNKWPHSFSFNKKVLRTQSASFKDIVEREIAKIADDLELLNYFLDHVQPRQDWVPFERMLIEDGIAVTPNYRYRLHAKAAQRASAPGAPTSPPPQLTLLVEGTKGNEIASFTINGNSTVLPRSVDEFREVVQSFKEDQEATLAEQNRRLLTISGEAPEVWSFADFLYFSTITQTTVGYGDILPNSTMVRIVVVVQIVFGLLLIGVAINFIAT